MLNGINPSGFKEVLHMKRLILAILMMAGLTISAVVPAQACTVAGPNKHVGQVLSVDNKAGTFTIMDAQTNAPISFTASTAILGEAAKATGAVMVSYIKSGDRLVAKDIHY